MKKWSVLILCILITASGAEASKSIAYEGDLSSNGGPANGWFDLRFRVFDGRDAGMSQPVGNEVVLSDVLVTDGRVQVEVEVDEDVDGAATVWLEIGVKPAGAFGDFITLEPRQRISPQSTHTKAAQSGTMPAGAIAFFQSFNCPDGWSEYTAARGRYFIGAGEYNTIGATVGTPLTDQEERWHDHNFVIYGTSEGGGAHVHAWSNISLTAQGDRLWTSYNESGASTFVTAWDNGIGESGSGYYPISAEPTTTFYTSPVSSHQHYVSLEGLTGSGRESPPYIQLLACRKD